MHGIKMLLAAAEQLAATAECLPDASNSMVEMAGNLLEPLGGTQVALLPFWQIPHLEKTQFLLRAQT
jgi:hypothetical protein